MSELNLQDRLEQSDPTSCTRRRPRRHPRLDIIDVPARASRSDPDYAAAKRRIFGEGGEVIGGSRRRATARS